MNKIALIQSKNWWQSKDIDWFISNALFAFTNNGYKGNRVRIVTSSFLGNFNCFEFDNDRYGILITSETIFAPHYSIKEKTKDNNVLPMLINFLEDWGADEFVDPTFCDKLKARTNGSKIIKIDYNEKNNLR